MYKFKVGDEVIHDIYKTKGRIVRIDENNYLYHILHYDTKEQYPEFYTKFYTESYFTLTNPHMGIDFASTGCSHTFIKDTWFTAKIHTYCKHCGKTPEELNGKEVELVNKTDGTLIINNWDDIPF